MSDIEEVLQERGNHYGTFLGNATLTQELTTSIRLHRTLVGKDKLPPIQQEALEMILHKVSRIVNGDPNYIENWRDISGYSQLVVDYLSTLEGASDGRVVKLEVKNGVLVDIT